MTANASLRAIKTLHTIVWAFFVGCIVAIPLFSLKGNYRLTAIFTGVVLIEILILMINGMRCPLTNIAAKYTDDRRANFDIYLPLWLARHNKIIFGLLFFCGAIFAFFSWLGWFD